MSLTNKKNLYLIFLLFSFHNLLNAQINVGLLFGYNYDNNSNITRRQKSNSTIGLNCIYKNQSRFQPFGSIKFTSIPLHFNEKIFANQGDLKTIANIPSTSFELGAGTILKNYIYSSITSNFGFGFSSLRNPEVFVENSNKGIGFASYYNNKTQKLFSFLSLDIKYEIELNQNWKINFNIGSQYYPNNDVSITSVYTDKEIVLNSAFSNIRPFTNFTILYSFE